MVHIQHCIKYYMCIKPFCYAVTYSTLCLYSYSHTHVETLRKKAHCRSSNNQSVGSSVPVVSRWLWPGNRTILEVASMVVTWRIVAFLLTESSGVSSSTHTTQCVHIEILINHLWSFTPGHAAYVGLDNPWPIQATQPSGYTLKYWFLIPTPTPVRGT